MSAHIPTEDGAGYDVHFEDERMEKRDAYENAVDCELRGEDRTVMVHLQYRDGYRCEVQIWTESEPFWEDPDAEFSLKLSDTFYGMRYEFGGAPAPTVKLVRQSPSGGDGHAE